MAGNVKEWCVNEVTGEGRRYILGGGWNEPSYRFAEQDARSPWLRLETFGVRLVKNLGPATAATLPVGRVSRDPGTIVPVGDEEFAIYRRLYEYDRTPLHAQLEAVDDSNPYWRKETVSFAAAYSRERVPAYLFLPKQTKPPYQTVVLFPSGYARVVRSSRSLDIISFEFLLRSGRAVLYPVYQGTFERRGDEELGRSAQRDLRIQWAKDFFRAVDYLETRNDIDMQRLAYFSVSMGAFFGPIPVALEPRLKAAVFASAGLTYGLPPETQPANFSARVRIPVLVVNGKDDFGVPVDAQRRFFEILGTAPDQKRHAVLDGGHVPQDRRALMREVLDWYDKYLGVVK
jgi:dipeptidyl aminopeptidase/acylaminoacyl peptidase